MNKEFNQVSLHALNQHPVTNQNGELTRAVIIYMIIEVHRKVNMQKNANDLRF